jgi:hypothetical protein
MDSDAADWRDDLQASRDLSRQEKCGFGVVIGSYRQAPCPGVTLRHRLPALPQFRRG